MCNLRSVVQVICISFLVIQSVESLSDGLNNSTRIRRQANKNKGCGKLKFACKKDGACIDSDKECDGIADCTDASDESNSCHRIKCPKFVFTCKYGACINKDLECDGKPDCRDGSDENTPKCRKTDQSEKSCSEDQFRCSSGQCIALDDKCDGKAECDDHSDELRATCWNVDCPRFAHKCSYGACVNGKAVCNGKVECFDGSDEDPTLCGPTGTPTSTTTTETPIVTRPPVGLKGSCILPYHPQFGQWTVNAPGTFTPGTAVSPGTILRVACNKSYKLDGSNVLFCEDGKWTSEIGQCLKVCPPILSTPTMTVTCVYKNRETINCTDAVQGTLAKFKCSPFYEDLALKRNPIHICHDGSWDHPKPQCTPVCGQKTVEATELIINGTDVKKGDYPWQVALYTRNNEELICGGSLLSQRVILTAAHCVTNERGDLKVKENYVVAVGKYYRQFNDSRDRNEAQFSDIKELYKAEQYQGDIQNYLGDIAVIITVKTFTLSRRVQPVCLDKGQLYNVQDNTYGYVTGWGFTVENKLPSDVLKEVKVPSVSISSCRQNIPEDYEIYLTYDKLCAGYLDKQISVCKGDSGGGLVFKHDGRYYVTGIVSLSPLSPTSGGCDSRTYALYTKVSAYIESFLLPKLASVPN